MEKDDLSRVLDVLRLALGEPPGLDRTAGLWRWKHIDNPFGPSIVLVAESGGRIAGVRAFMRWDLITPRGDTLRCVRAVDTATHPDFHRQGIFRTLTEAAVDNAVSAGIHLIFNTPNPRSGAGYLKMGWSEVGPIRVMVRPGLRLLRRDLDGTSSIDADPGPPTVPIRDRAPLGLRTARTPEYLTWRYGSHPTAVYRSVTVGESAAVVRENSRRRRSELVVSDLLGPRPGKALGEVARRSTAAYMVGSFAAGSPERRVAIRHAMLPVPRVRALTLYARPLDGVDDVTDLDGWDISLGDLELL